jgi:mannose-6-phosphate isomerase
MAQALLVLDNPVQNYAWGSRQAIASFLGRPVPSPEPEAELWIGAHPKAPSRARAVAAGAPATGERLDRLIAADPAGLLGPGVSGRFGPELPFLFKVLAAAEPLSIQAHPDRQQAREGFARENARGVPLESPLRNYRDPNHKPELVCALTPFDALKGFRPGGAIARHLAPVAGSELAKEVALAADSSPAGLRALLRRLLAIDGADKQAVLARTSAEAERRGGSDDAWRWVSRLLARYPQDAGVLAPLYLNLVPLLPGEALYLPAGELHAYLEGTALEIMANSDNVLRGGLTPKHVDAGELLATLAFEPHPPEVLRGEPAAPGERVFRTPAREFELSLIDVAPIRRHVAPARRSVEILLGVEGDAVIRAGGETASLARGASVLVPAALAGYELTGEGRVARARVPA